MEAEIRGSSMWLLSEFLCIKRILSHFLELHSDTGCASMIPGQSVQRGPGGNEVEEG